MSTQGKQSPNILQVDKRGKDTQKTEQLKDYLNGLKYHPPVSEHGTIARSFGVPNYRPIFRADAVRRFINATHSEPTTAATVSNLTGITHKYLCQLKKNLEEAERIKVVGFGQCETTRSHGVQYLSSNPDNWNDDYPKSNQISLFSDDSN